MGKYTSLGKWLTGHVENPSAPRHVRIHLLMWLLLFSILINTAILVQMLIFKEEQSPNRDMYIWLVIALMGLLIFAFFLNRRGYFYFSSGVFVACAVIGPWASLLLDPAVIQGDFVPLVYVSLSVLLSSILLPLVCTISIAVLQYTVLILVLLYSPSPSFINLPSFFAYMLFFSGLSIIANLLSKRDMEYINQQRDQLIRATEQLEELSIRDHITNLFNRRYLEVTLQHEIQRASERKIPIGIVMLDIDHFKEFNDTMGHAAGDYLLKKLGNFLCTQVRIVDIICRYGGDEFTIVLPGASTQFAKDLTENIRVNVKHILEGSEYSSLNNVSISQGVAFFPDQGSTMEDILKTADAALYRAKQEGRDQVVFAELPRKNIR